MKIIFRFILIFIFLIVAAFTAGYAYLRAQGQDLLAQTISREWKLDVRFASLTILYPLTLKMVDVQIEGVGQVRELRCVLSLTHLLAKQIYFSHVELVEPDFLINKKKDESWSLSAWMPAAHRSESFPEPLSATRRLPSFHVGGVKRIIIERGSIMIFESAENESRLIAEVKDWHLDLGPVIFPFTKPHKMDFVTRAIFSGLDGRLQNVPLALQGWADLYHKDMDATLRLDTQDDQPGLEAHVQSTRNEMLVRGRVNTAFHSQLQKKEDARPGVGVFLLQAMQSSGVSLDLNFQFKTKMDAFQIGQVKLSGAVMKKAPPGDDQSGGLR